MERSSSDNNRNNNSNNSPRQPPSSSSSSSISNNKQKLKTSRKSSTSNSHRHNQPTSTGHSLKKKESKSFRKVEPKPLNTVQSNSNNNTNNDDLIEASTSAAAAVVSSLPSSSRSSLHSKIHQKRIDRKERRSNREEEKKKRKEQKRQENRRKDQNKLSDELRHYFGLAIKNSLGHMHDHLIATLPDEMSLYYQKLHDTLLLDVNQEDNSNPNANTTNIRPTMNEMHEFVTASDLEATSSESQTHSSAQHESKPSNVQKSSATSQNRFQHIPYNPYAPPMHKPGILPIKDFLNDPVSASLNTLNRVSNLVRVPTSQIYSQGYNILNNLASPVNIPTTSSPTVTRPPGTAERIICNEDEDGIPAPPPALPLIQCTHQQTRLEPLDSEEFESKTWTIDTLRQRVFQGGVADKLRLHLWPYILGLHDDDASIDFKKKFDWTSKQKSFEHYRSQWQSILPEQEKRFMLFRERKSLIERDVIRCDRTHPFYQGDNNENLTKLKEILLTYMMYNFDTGYVQGMSDLVSPLLYVAQGDTCKAFWFFVQTMEFTSNNFEMSQLTIKNQLEMLWKLIELTDPIFAQYLANNDSVNCYFAFRWIVCQFKREFMKSNSDDYQEVLLLWESLWTCSSMKKYFKNLRRQQHQQQQQQMKSESKSEDNIPSNSMSTDESVKKEDGKLDEASDLPDQMNKQCKISDDSSRSCQSSHESSAESLTTNYSTESGKLSETELYVLCICLAIIRRERDLIMVQRYDATEILKHFNTLQLNSNLKNILIHAANIWSWLIFDENEKLLYTLRAENNSTTDEQHSSKNFTGLQSSSSSSANMRNAQTSPAVAPGSTNNDEDFDLLQDLRLPLDRSAVGSSSPANVPTSSANDDYYIFT